MTVICKDCIFYSKFLIEDTDGECRRYPPKVSYTGYANDRKETDFPKVHDYLWCGEAKKK